MLTVKHIDSDGTETILEAERVEKVRTGSLGEDGIFLDREPVDSTPGILGSSQVPRSFRHVIHFCDARSSNESANPTVYVMNRYGATVATYHL